jgi:hypothetical protein
MFSHAVPGRGDDDPAAAAERPWSPAQGPPEDEVGAAVSVAAVVGRSQDAAVALSQATVYSEGMTFHFVALARGLGLRQSSRLLHDQQRFDEADEPGDGFLRLGLELPDGRRVSNLGVRIGHGRYASLQEPARLVFFEHGGGGGSGGGGRLSLRPAFWLWPLPDTGAIQVFCEWPVVGISLSSLAVEVGPLLEARERVVPLWPPSA